MSGSHDRYGTGLRLRPPYVGEGADGARRSAQIDLEEADGLSPGRRRDECLLSAERWMLEAEEHDRRAAEFSGDVGGTGFPQSDHGSGGTG